MSLGQSLQPSLRPELLPSKHYPSCEMTLYLRFRLGLPETSILTEIRPEHGGTFVAAQMVTLPGDQGGQPTP